MRHTRSHTANRRSHHALKAQQFSLCSNCGAPKTNHQMCLNCGKYGDKVVIDVQKKLMKKEKKQKEREKAARAS